MDGIALPPDLEQFAAEIVASGRYRDIDDVVRAGLDLVRRHEMARSMFVATLEAAEAEADRDGWVEIDDVLKDVDVLIEAAERGGG